MQVLGVSLEAMGIHIPFQFGSQEAAKNFPFDIQNFLEFAMIDGDVHCRIRFLNSNVIG